MVSALSAMLLIALGVQPAVAAQPSTPTAKTNHGARHLRSVQVIHAAGAGAPTVQVQSASGHDGGVLANFNGVGSLDSAVTNFGAEFEPPDQGLCAGNGYVVEMVNSAFRIYDTRGHTLAGPTNVNAPFHDGFAQFTSDPRCQYDAATNTWFAVVLFLNDTFTGSRLEIAYNTSGDPRTDWSTFKVDTTDANAPAANGCPCFGDQPRLGIDAYNIYVGSDNFSINGPQFNGAEIYAISKSDLVHSAANVHFVYYPHLTVDGGQAFGIQPALTSGPAPAEYFLSSLDPNGTGDTRIALWALTDPSRVSSGQTPHLSSLIVNSEAYVSPAPSPQKGSASTLDSGDDRMQQTQFINGEIWGELGTSLIPAGDTAARAGIAWFRVRPQLNGSHLRSATVTAQGYLGSAGNNLLYPALQADGAGHAAMVFTITSAQRFPSAAYSVLSGDGAFGRPVVFGAGTGPYDANATRWGDYSWAVLDSGSDSVWMATEYVPPASSQTTDGRRNWGTRVIHVELA